MNFLFFDIECANSYGKHFSICSFGYCITTDNFKILKKEDLVINPESKFEKRLLDKNSDCSLAYTEDFFVKQPNFDFFYPKIKELLSNNIVLGFSVKNDIKFLNSTCKRYNKPYINFNAGDIQILIRKKYKKNPSLSSLMKSFGIKCSNLTAHKSSDDAEMTMLVTREFCNKERIKPFDLYDKTQVSVQAAEIERREYFNKYRAYYHNKIKDLYTSSKNNLESQIQLYKPVINKKYDIEQTYNLLSFFHNKGIQFTEDESTFPILLYPDDVHLADEYSAIKHLKMMNFKDVISPIEYKQFTLGKQRCEILDINEEIDAYFKLKSKKDFQILLEDKTSEYVEKKCINPISNKLDGKIFRLAFSKRDNLESVVQVYKDIYENGGYIVKRKQPYCIIVKSNKEKCPDWIVENNEGIIFKNVHTLYQELELDEPEV